jgi:hypothetical protein
MSTITTTSSSTPAPRRVTSEKQKARRDARVASLIDGLAEECNGLRYHSPRAQAIYRSLRMHLRGMSQHITTAVEAELETPAAEEVARLVAHFEPAEAPHAWEQVVHHHVDRIARRARAIGQALDRVDLAQLADSKRRELADHLAI